MKSRFLQGLEAQSHIYFNVLLGVLVLLLLDAIREMYSYSHIKTDVGSHHIRDLDQDMQLSMKTFRAQRNFYISGFSLLLWVVIRRLVTMICSAALTELNLEASRRQAEGASKEASRLRDLVDESEGVSAGASGELKKEVEELRQRLQEEERENKRKSKEMEAMKAQAEGLSKEYDRLSEEYNKLEVKLRIGGGDKKDS